MEPRPLPNNIRSEAARIYNLAFPEKVPIDPTEIEFSQFESGFNICLLISVKGDKYILKKSLTDAWSTFLTAHKRQIFSQVQGCNYGAIKYYFDGTYCLEEVLPGGVVDKDRFNEPSFLRDLIEESAIFTATLEMNAHQTDKQCLLLERRSNGLEELLSGYVNNILNFRNEEAQSYAKGLFAEYADNESFWKFTNRVCNSTLISPQLVLSHADITETNLIFNPADSKITLIDYEFAGFYPILYDVSTILLERSRDQEGHIDPSKIPSDEEILKYSRLYLDMIKKHGVGIESQDIQDEQLTTLVKQTIIFCNAFWLICYTFDLCDIKWSEGVDSGVDKRRKIEKELRKVFFNGKQGWDI